MGTTMIVLKFFAFLILGAVFIEGAGYAWHRWACHVGVVRRLFNDFFRRRHFNHHMEKYPPKRLASSIYEESCEVAFHPLGMLFLLSMAVLMVYDVLDWGVGIPIVLGAVLYGIYGLGWFHSLYHLENEHVRGMWLFKTDRAWSIFQWLRDYHSVHHYLNANFAIIIPIFDMIGGTYVSPMRLRTVGAENLFPAFDPKLSAECGGRLFRR